MLTILTFVVAAPLRPSRDWGSKQRPARPQQSILVGRYPATQPRRKPVLRMNSSVSGTATGSNKPPLDYPQMYTQIVESVEAALANNMRLIEVQFPATANMATAALNQILDANRDHVRYLASSLAARKKAASGPICVCFPDRGEANLASKLWSQQMPNMSGFHISTIKDGAQQDDQLIIVVNPGFNIPEWLDMETELNKNDTIPILVVNGDMDRVRNGYYPRIFYPKLYDVNQRFLKFFEPIYIVKPFAKGLLFRRYPQQWQLFHKAKDGYRLVDETAERPKYLDVENRLRNEDFKQ